MGKILALWAIPRSTSTAFEKMMSQRGDFNCLHEPFGEAWYFGEDRRAPRPNDRPPVPGLTFDSVWKKMRKQAAEGPVFNQGFYPLCHPYAGRCVPGLFPAHFFDTQSFKGLAIHV